MKLYCLSGNPNRPCFVLKFKQLTVMLDCGLDIGPMIDFLPLSVSQTGQFVGLPGWSPPNLPGGVKLHDELKDVTGKIFVDSEPEFCVPELTLLDMSQIDIILISNHHCMLALPYITEYTSFRGQVLTTEPTMQIGRLFMEEMVEFIKRSPKSGRAVKWKADHILGHLPAPLKDAVRPMTWRQIYSKRDIHACLSKVTTLTFGQKFEVFGSLTVTPYSSGYALGSSNWVLQSQFEKITYVSGSSTLTTHPKPLEQSALRNSDVMLLTRLTQTPTCNPDAMIGEFCINSAVTLRNGGNVLVPCYPSGVTYDLFECLSRHLDSCSMLHVPLYFISPVADSSLAYSNIYAEWLSNDKSSRVYLPEPPFPHAELVKASRLIHVPNIHSLPSEMKTPCVVFTGHPSLRVGDVVHFLELWGKSSSNTLVITEPDFQYLEALAPYQPLAMKVSYCPIDTSLSFTQANKLIRELRPQHLITSESYMTPPAHFPHHANLVLETDICTPITYTRAEILTLPIKRQYEQIELDPVIATTMLPVEVTTGVSIATITGELHGKDNKYILKPVQEPGCNGQRRMKREEFSTHPKAYHWGSLDLQEFIQLLNKAGIQDVKVEDGPTGGHIVHLPSEDTLIQIEEGSTHIISEGNEEVRIKLKDILLKCLAKF